MTTESGMAESATLRIDIRAWWHAGTGRGSASHLDTLVARDSDQLPFLPGKTLKGLLRDAMWQWEYWERNQSAETTEALFGRAGVQGGGAIYVPNARMPLGVRQALNRPENRSLQTELFDSLFSTAISHQTGAALPKSLRGMEVALPVLLESEIRPVDRGRCPPDWATLLKEALPYVRAVGAHRTRGLGRAVLSLRWEGGAA